MAQTNAASSGATIGRPTQDAFGTLILRSTGTCSGCIPGLDLGQPLGSKVHFLRSQSVIEMRWGASADKNGSYQRILEHPGHCELQRRHAHSYGQAMQQSYAGKIALIEINIRVPRDHIEAGAFGHSRTISGVFASEETRGEWAVGHYAHLLALHHGESIMSRLQQVVRQLDRFKAPQAQPATGFEGRLQLRTRMIAAASGASETRADDGINRGRGFFDRRDAVVAVIKIKIDAVGLESAEAGLNRGTDMVAGEFPSNLGHQGNLVATAAGL